jgi:hypothetical protein
MAYSYTGGIFKGFLDDNSPAVGALLYTYASGTATPLATFTDSTLGTPNANPVQLDSRGEAQVWLGDSPYTFQLKTVAGALIGASINGVSVPDIGLRADLASTASGKGAALVGFKPASTASSTTVDAYLKSRSLIATAFPGVDPTGVADSTTGLQAWLDACVAGNHGGFWPSGIYKISSPLMVYLAGTFIHLHIRGEGVTTRTDKGVILDHTAITDRPAIIVQGARSVSIEFVQFIGPNNFTTTNFLLASDFNNGSCRDTQYSPQCAIAIDPFSTGLPPDGGYSGLSSFYNSTTSLAGSQVRISRCRFRNQVVGISASPGGWSINNNEDGAIEYCSFTSVKVAISFGQLNHKGWLITNINASNVHTVVDDYTYSTKTGSSGFTWVGGDIANCTHLVKTLSMTGGAGVITQKGSLYGVYAENIWSIGFIGDSGNFNLIPFSFQNCTFWLRSGETISGKDASMTSFAPVSFRDCTFIAPNAVGARTYGFPIRFYHSTDRGQKNTLLFDQCTFQCAPAVLFNREALKWVKMRGVTHRSATNKAQGFRASFDEVYRADDGNDFIGGNYQVWPGSFIDDKATGNLLRVQLGMGSVSLGSPTVSLSNYNATFTATDPLVLAASDAIYVSTCSIERIDGTTLTALNWPIGIIKTIVGSTITLEGIGLNAPSGAIALTCMWYPAAHVAATAATTSGSPNITVTHTVTGFNDFAAGQRIQGTGIPAGASILSGTYPNYVLTHNATATNAAVRVFDADARLITTTLY